MRDILRLGPSVGFIVLVLPFDNGQIVAETCNSFLNIKLLHLTVTVHYK
jgi:hypothetical protein